MRVGIDATALPFQPVGAGIYTIQLIRSLAQLDGGSELVVFAFPHARELIDPVGNLPIEWVILHYQKPAQRLVWEQLALPGIVRNSHVELLHSPHYTRPVRLSCSSVVTFHDRTFFIYPYLHTRAKRLYFPVAMRLSSRQADAIIAVSENTRQDAIRIMKIPPDKITTIHSGVSSLFRPIEDPPILETVRQKYHLPLHFILYVGTIEPRKNLPMLLRAYHALEYDETRLPLVLVGKNGWMYEQIYQMIRELNLADRVLTTGYIPTEDLPMVYNLADLFVYPSLYEGFGFPPLEAMACGIPVITSAVSSMPEHVGEAGVLVPAGDENALTKTLQLLLSNQALRQELASKGLNQAAQFSWSRAAEKTMQLYERLLQTRTRQ